MGEQADAMFSPGDVMRELRELRAEVALARRERRLEKASVGAGGVTIKGGFLRILDKDGNETMRLATDGLSLEGFLQVVGNIEIGGDDGKLEILDANGDVQMTLSPDELSMSGLMRVLAGLFEWEDDAGNVRMSIGLQGNASFPDAESVRLIYSDAGGFNRVYVGEILDGVGDPAGDGLLVQDGSGDDILTARDGRALLSMLGEGGGFVWFSPTDDDEIDLYDENGNFRATIGPVTWSGSPDGYGILLQDASGADRLFVSDNRVWIRTTDGRTGEVTAGPADSGGTGSRALVIPN